MTDAEKCCIWLDYIGYEAHHLNGQVWITMWNRALTETLELEISADEVRHCAQDFDQEYKLHESFRKWLEESQTLVRLVPEKVCDECGYVDDEVASHYEECSKLDKELVSKNKDNENLHIKE